MKRKRSLINIDLNKNLKYTVLILLLGFTSVYSFWNFQKNNEPNLLVENKTKKVQKVYPKLYSTENITENAKISDERFKNLSFFNKESLLSSAVFSLFHRGEEIKSTQLERGIWLWTPIKYINSEYTAYIVNEAKKNNKNVIYLAVDSYLDIFVLENSEEKKKQKEEFVKNISSFIGTANASGIEVDAVAGWQNWAEEGHLYKPGAIIDFVLDYNKNNLNKFRGLQYDVEPYLLPEYKTEKERVLVNFLELIDKTILTLKGSNLLFTVVVPEFFDDSTTETKIYKYKGKTTFTFEHLLDILEKRKGSKMIVMSYRNFAKGVDGSIEISKDEVYLANNYSTKIILAQETGNFEPSYITFHNTSKNRYKREVSILEETFSNELSFGGISTHYANSFFELK